MAVSTFITSIESDHGAGAYGPWTPFTFTVNFSENMDVTGTPTLTLNNGATATYAGGTGTAALFFTYTVGDLDSGQDIAELAVTALNGTVVSNPGGEPPSAAGFPFTFTGETIDTTADALGDLALTIPETSINNAQKTAVSFEVSGLDDDSTATITFSSNGGGPSIDVPVTANGIGTADLSGLFDGAISSMLSTTDAAGNHAGPIFGSPFMLDTQAPFSPYGLQLSAGDDTGLFPYDGVTKFTSYLTITGQADSGTTVSLFDDSNGNGVRDASEAVLTSGPSGGGGFMAEISSLTEGTHHIVAFQTDAAGNVSGNSPPLQITVDTTADVGGNLALNFPVTLVGGPGAGAVAFTVAGLDPDIVNAEVTFNVGGFFSFTIDASSGAGTVDLSFFSGSVFTSLNVTDLAGNTAFAPGPILNIDASADADHNLMLIIAGNPNINAGGKGAVGFSISGQDGDVTAAEVTFSDSVGNVVTVNAFEASVADLSSFVDGPISAVLQVTDMAGNTASTNGMPPHTIDTTADSGAPAVLAVDPVISASDDLSAVSFTVTGVDSDFGFGFVTFTDSLGNSPGFPYSITGNGTYAIDLSGLAEGPITSTMTIFDSASNSANIAGNTSLFNTSSSISMSIGFYRGLGDDAAAQLADYSEVILQSNAGGIAGLTLDEIASLGPAGVTSIHSVTGSFALTRAQFEALPATVALTAADTVILRDTGDNLGTLPAYRLSEIYDAGVDKLDASDNVLSLSVDQVVTLHDRGMLLTNSDVVTLADTSDELLLTGLDLSILAPMGIDRIDATDDSLSLTVSQYKDLAKVAFAGDDTVTLADADASIQSLITSTFAGLAAKGVDRIDATDDLLTLTLAKYQALNGVELTDSDEVTLRDTGAIFAGLDFAALAANGVDILDASKNVLSLTVEQYQALRLASLELTAADAVTLADDGANFAGLDFAPLAAMGIDKIDATGGLSITVAQYEALNGVTLTAADVVTLADESANFAGLDFAPLAAMGIDRIDATGDNHLSISLAQFDALGKVLLTESDAVIVSGTPGNDSFVFSNQTFTDNDMLFAIGGTDSLRLTGDYSGGLTFGAGSLSGIDKLFVGAGHYDLSVADGASDPLLSVFATKQGAADSLSFDGSAETHGSFKFYGGPGTSTFTGGNHSDAMTAGGGMDIARYTAASQSLLGTHDTITGFDAGVDKFDVGHAVTVDAGASGALSTSTMGSVLASAFAGLQDNHAAVFTATGGSLNGAKFLVVDMNHVTGYQAGADIMVRLNGSTGTIDHDTFLV